MFRYAPGFTQICIFPQRATASIDFLIFQRDMCSRLHVVCKKLHDLFGLTFRFD